MTKFILSFGQWCLENNREDLITRWDTELNGVTIFDVAYKSNKKFYMKCPRGIHDSELCAIQYVASGRTVNVRCSKCQSFAQHIIDEFGEDYLYAIWSDKNTITPWDVTYKSSKKMWFRCLENPEHEDYLKTIQNVMEGQRCPKCYGKAMIKERSLGYVYPRVFNIWSNKNDKTPYDYLPNSTHKIWWKCPQGKHDDYLRSVNSSLTLGFRCPMCSKEKLLEDHFEDLTGHQFGMLTVLEFSHKDKNNNVYWKCMCECGTIKLVCSGHLKDGSVKTCGNHKDGEKNPNWKGGVVSVNARIRTSEEYQQWRSEVLKHDWYICQCCGSSEQLEVHHINNFADHVDQRFDVSNGITLCHDCHNIYDGFHHDYGTKNNTFKQLEDYINNKRQHLKINEPFTIEGYLNGQILKKINKK